MSTAASHVPLRSIDRWRALGVDGLETMLDGPEVAVLSNGELAVVVLDRPPVNALGETTYGSLAAAFDSVAGDSRIRCVLLVSGSPRAFCAGADRNERGSLGASPTARQRRERAVSSLYGALADVPAPVVAVIDGPCIGAGAVLASIADIRIATPAAWFALPEIDIQAVGGARHLMRLVPVGIVRDLALTGRRLDMDEAQRLGFVSRRAPDGSALETAMEVARTLLAKDHRTLLATKATLTGVEELRIADGFEFEQAVSFRLGMTGALESS